MSIDSLNDRIDRYHHLERQLREAIRDGRDSEVILLDRELSATMNAILDAEPADSREIRFKLEFLVSYLESVVERSSLTSRVLDELLAIFDRVNPDFQ